MEPEKSEDLINKGKKFYSDGNFEEAIRCYCKVVELNIDNASILIKCGIALCDVAKKQKAEPLFEYALKLFEKAMLLAPDNPSVFCFWGIELFELAEMKQEEALFVSAIEKFDRAAYLESNNALVFYYWGFAFSQLALIRNVDALFEYAFEKFDNAIHLNPDDIRTLYIWGNSLSKLAYLKQDEKLFNSAFEKFEKVTQLDSKNYTSFFIWGIMLSHLAKIKQNEALFDSAFEKFDKATTLAPRFVDAFLVWGDALSDLAKIKHDDALFESAFRKFDAATKQDSQKAEAFYHWGISLSESAKIKKDRDVFESAFEKFNNATLLESNNAIVFYHWGIALSTLAQIEQDDISFKRAFEKFDIAAKLNRDDRLIPWIFCDWGVTLYKFAGIKNDENLYKEAIEHLIKSKREILDIFVALYANNEERLFQTEHFYTLLDKPSNNNDALFFAKITENIKGDEVKLNKYKDIYLRSIYIISQLHVHEPSEKHVAHYCRKDVLQKLLFENNSKFWLNAINYSNDPLEGKTLLDFLYGENNSLITEELTSEYEAFAGCFTFSYDSLNQFRLYGKNDDKEEGTGVSLVIRDSFFSNDAKMAIKMLQTNSSDNDFSSKIGSFEVTRNNSIEKDKFALFRCIYVDPDPQMKQNVITVGQKEIYLFYKENCEKDFEKYSGSVDKIIEHIRCGIRDLKKTITDEKLESTIVGQLLINLRYLVKHVAFKEENECRIVRIANLSKDRDIIIDKEFKRMYLEYLPRISMHIDSILWGPKTEGFELFKSMLKNNGLSICCKKSKNHLA